MIFYGITTYCLLNSVPFDLVVEGLGQYVPSQLLDKYCRKVEILRENPRRPFQMGSVGDFKWYVGFNTTTGQPYLNVMYDDRRQLNLHEAKIVERCCFPNGVAYPASICAISVDETVRQCMITNYMQGEDWSRGLN